MSKFDKLIKNKQNSAKYMMNEIAHICKNIPKRTPGSEGEKLSCEYMADVLKKDCGCERSDVESFSENPGSFFGWIYFTVTFALLALVFYFFLPVVSVVLSFLGFFILVLQFGLYKKFVDCFFKKATGHNVTAIKKCTGEVKARIFFNGHPDAAWNWPVNNRFGGKVYIGHLISAIGGSLYAFMLQIIASCVTKAQFGVISPATHPVLFWFGISTLIFVPSLVGLYFMWQKNVTVDGANDNLTGCYMGIAILKAMKDEGIQLKHTEVGVILSGSEEAGLRGAKAWCEAHKGEFDDVPTFIYSYDTIHDKKFLAVNYRDLNGTVKADKQVSDLFMDAADELDIHCEKGMVPPFGGATDSAAFAQAGFRATGITAMNHVLEDYYHTLKDTYTNLSQDGLADCYAVSVKVLEKFDEEYSEDDD